MPQSGIRNALLLFVVGCMPYGFTGGGLPSHVHTFAVGALSAASFFRMTIGASGFLFPTMFQIGFGLTAFDAREEPRKLASTGQWTDVIAHCVIENNQSCRIALIADGKIEERRRNEARIVHLRRGSGLA